MIKNIKELKNIITNIKTNEETKKRELITIFDNAKSFYKKAYTITIETNEHGTIKLLYSYNTLVCAICNYKYILNTDIQEKLLYSQTTLRHIKEFLKQNRYAFDNYEKLNIETKKDIIKNNNYKEEF